MNRNTLLLAAAIALLAAAVALATAALVITHQLGAVRVGPHKVMTANEACLAEFPGSPDIPDAVTTANFTNCVRFIENEQMEARYRHAEARTR